LHCLSDEIRNQLLSNLDTADLTNVAEFLDPTELADSLDALPDTVSDTIMSSLDAET